MRILAVIGTQIRHPQRINDGFSAHHPHEAHTWNPCPELGRMVCSVETVERTYSPITAITFDPETGTMWGGASDYGEDYGVAW